MTGAERGFVTLASTRPHYLEFAVDLALSLREFNAEPIALVLGDELRPFATPAHLAAFDRVIALPPQYRRNMGKLHVARATPFERTLYVDADCLAIGSLDDVWQRLDAASFAVQGHFIGRDEEHEHHLFSTRRLMGRFGLRRYLKSNTGIVYFRKDAGVALADACLRVQRDGFGGRQKFDEILLGVAAEDFDITPIPPPLPMAWWPKDVEVDDRRYKIVHFIAPPRPATLRWLMGAVRRRRAAAGLPADASVAFWEHKVSPWSRRMIRDRVYGAVGEGLLRLRRAWLNRVRRAAPGAGNARR